MRALLLWLTSHAPSIGPAASILIVVALLALGLSCLVASLYPKPSFDLGKYPALEKTWSKKWVHRPIRLLAGIVSVLFSIYMGTDAVKYLACKISALHCTQPALNSDEAALAAVAPKSRWSGLWQGKVDYFEYLADRSDLPHIGGSIFLTINANGDQMTGTVRHILNTWLDGKGTGNLSQGLSIRRNISTSVERYDENVLSIV